MNAPAIDPISLTVSGLSTKVFQELPVHLLKSLKKIKQQIAAL